MIWMMMIQLLRFCFLPSYFETLGIVQARSPSNLPLTKTHIQIANRKPPLKRMATTNPSQLFLLADHIKLSLLERQRALQLNLPANSQDSQISRSLDQLSTGIDALERQSSLSSSSTDDPLRPSPERDQLGQLRKQYQELAALFSGGSDANGGAGGKSGVLNSPNNPALAGDFAAAQRRERTGRAIGSGSSKAVRFTDDPTEDDSEAARRTKANRAALFPYRDNPEEDEDAVPDQSHLNNQQIHEYHRNVITQQDEQLDQLGQSIGRQRELTIAIGSELDDQVVMLDEVDERVDRHQSQLDGAKKRLGGIMKKARDNWSLTTIIVLIIILVLLIVITK
jgi:syntaxin 8